VKCGTEYNADDRYCPKCGVQLNDSSDTAVAEMPPIQNVNNPTSIPVETPSVGNGIAWILALLPVAFIVYGLLLQGSDPIGSMLFVIPGAILMWVDKRKVFIAMNNEEHFAPFIPLAIFIACVGFPYYLYRRAERLKTTKSYFIVGLILWVLITVFSLFSIIGNATGLFDEQNSYNPPPSSTEETYPENSTNESEENALNLEDAYGTFDKADFDEISYEELARNPDKYEEQKVKITGTAIQDSFEVPYDDYTVKGSIISIDEYGEQLLYFEYTADASDVRIISGDTITIYGISGGIYTYESAVGTQSVPCLFAIKIE
jgi:hypothetical protein